MSSRLAVLLTFLLILASSPSRAITFYVSGSGNTSAACGSTTSPCISVTWALNKAGPSDNIVCLGPTADDFLSITKSIDIDCSAGVDTINNGTLGTSGPPSQGEQVLIDIPVSSSDPLRTVRLRGLSLVSSGGGGARIGKGVVITAAAAVFIENSAVTGCLQQCITNNGPQTRLYVTDSVVRNSGGPGIVAAASSGVAVLDNVRLENNAYGIAVASGNQVTISRSLISGNSVAGVEADGGSLVIVDGSTISNNNTGILSGSAIRLSNNNITFNTTGVSGATGTYGNNRFAGNGSDGTALTPVGAGSTDLAQK